MVSQMVMVPGVSIIKTRLLTFCKSGKSGEFTETGICKQVRKMPLDQPFASLCGSTKKDPMCVC